MMGIEPERQGSRSSAKQSGPAVGPTVLRIALGGQLRRLREDRGISREAAGEAIRGSHAKISRLELGRVSFRERDLNDLLTLYGVRDDSERAAFLSLARQANEPGWWHQYGDLLPSWFETYLGLEQAAEIIRTYEAQFVPGLLQTPDYARAVIMLGHGQEPTAEVDRRVALRMRRQDILTRPEPPTLWAVIDEAALRRPIGGERIMQGQIDHLIRVAELPNVTIQLLPYSVGGHAAAGGPFTIVRFPESDLPDVVYLEQLTSALYLDKRNDLDQYQAVMNMLSVQAATPEDTPQLLRELRDTY
ncbi:helix-turn-helix transcriptional regulator [Saccharopolyspora sp. TS4A08]|uniref:Helix-turn-helix transcriptional regulator n=1 Tax=Saccharopolyspora ipomoeae TaxID=3042027 RepID=A0ABT6PGS6_9PSEU|nr:helix-turn-helix transcriptional regulator [Saccharopolyspora sp. TS4A08]MDI2027192.1 helix-turn-helix transcriptional regulator [Saccharopolyspora sp. TS4A08]